MITNDTRALMETAGFTTDVFNGGNHLKFSNGDIILTYWPSTERWLFAALSFKTTVERVLKAVKEGRFKVEGDPVPCKHCGREVVWITTKRGKKCPVQLDGDAHISNCPGRRP